MAKLFQTVVVWDVVVWAETEDDANKAALANISEGLAPSEYASYDYGRRPIREAWKAERPLVGAAVSDADFERVKGKTCDEVWKEINTKPPEAPKKASAK